MTLHTDRLKLTYEQAEAVGAQVAPAVTAILGLDRQPDAEGMADVVQRVLRVANDVANGADE